MTKRITVNRGISVEETVVIRTALEKAAVAEFQALGSKLQHLRAIDQCGCGCDSVDFVTYNPSNPPKPLAQGIGETPRGGTVGVIVWGTSEGVTGLEIFDLGAGDDDLKLPVPDSIRPW